MAAATTPQSAFGAAVTWAGHDIGYITNIAGPSIKAETIDISSHDSADGYREFVAGMLDGGELTLECLFISGDLTGQKYFLTDLHAKTERQVIVTLPDGSTHTFNALPTGFEPTYNYDNKQVVTISMKVSGKPVFAASV